MTGPAAPAAPAAAPSAPARTSKPSVPAPSAPAAETATKAPTIAGTGTGNAGGSDAAMKSATSNFRRGQRQADAPVPREIPDVREGVQDEGEAAPNPINQDEPTATDEPEGEPTAKAYPRMDSDLEDDAQADGSESGDPAEQGTTQDTPEQLAAFDEMFGLPPGSMTPGRKAGIINDVETSLAKAREGRSEQAGSPPSATDNQARPQTPASSSPTAPAPAAAPKAPATGSEALAPLSDDDIKAIGKLGEDFDNPGLLKLATSFNQLLEQATKPATETVQLRQQLQAVQGELQWMRVQPVVSKFVGEQVKRGFPAIPEEKLHEFASEAAEYLEFKNGQAQKAGKPLMDPKAAMSAVYMKWTGEQVQEQAAGAEERGAQRVVGSLAKRQRRFDVAGGPGATRKTGGSDDSASEIAKATRNFRRGQQQAAQG